MNESNLIRRIPDNRFLNSIISFSVGRYNQHHDLKVVQEFRQQNSYSDSFELAKPLVAAYIPTYNRVKYLIERSIPSVLAQTYPNIQLIISDDGSSDNTLGTIREIFGNQVVCIASRRDQYRYPNKSIYHWFAGPVLAANRALSNMNKFHWIARLDDDDEWLPDHIEKSLDCVISHKYEFISSQYLALRGNTSNVIGADANNGIGGTQTWLYHSGLAAMRYNIHCWRKSINRVNDTDLQDRFFKAGVRIGFREAIGAIVKPRDGEAEIGSKAYLASPEKYEAIYGD